MTYTVEILEEAILLLERLGYEIHQQWLDTSASGICQFRGRKQIYLDLGLSPLEQLVIVGEALRVDPQSMHLEMSPALRQHLRYRKSA